MRLLRGLTWLSLGVTLSVFLVSPLHADTPLNINGWKVVTQPGTEFTSANARSLDPSAVEVTGTGTISGHPGFTYTVKQIRPAIVAVTWKNPKTGREGLQYFVVAPASLKVRKVWLFTLKLGRTSGLSFPSTTKTHVADSLNNFKMALSGDRRTITVLVSGRNPGMSYIVFQATAGFSPSSVPGDWSARMISATGPALRAQQMSDPLTQFILQAMDGPMASIDPPDVGIAAVDTGQSILQDLTPITGRDLALADRPPASESILNDLAPLTGRDLALSSDSTATQMGPTFEWERDAPATPAFPPSMPPTVPSPRAPDDGGNKD